MNNWDKSCEIIVEKLIREGFIKNFGVSIYTSDEFNKALENKYIKFIQIPFNIFDLRAINKKWFEKAKQRGKLIFIRSVFYKDCFLWIKISFLKNCLRQKNI